MEFYRPEYWSGYPFPSPGDLPNPGFKSRSPALLVDSLPAEPQRRPKSYPFSRASSQTSVWIQASCTAGNFFTVWTTREDQGNTCYYFLPQEFLFEYFVWSTLHWRTKRLRSQRHRVKPTFPTELWNIYEGAHDKIPRTKSSTEVSTKWYKAQLYIYSGIQKLIPLLMKENIIAKKKKWYAEWGDKSTSKKLLIFWMKNLKDKCSL